MATDCVVNKKTTTRSEGFYFLARDRLISYLVDLVDFLAGSKIFALASSASLNSRRLVVEVEMRHVSQRDSRDSLGPPGVI